MSGQSEQPIDRARLAGRYRMLLRAYPYAYRTERGEEIVGTYLELAEAQGRRRWPRTSDAADLVAAGLRERVRAGDAARAAAVPLAAALALCAAASLAGVWLATVEPRAVPPGVLLRGFGPFQTLGSVAWVGWVLTAVGAAVLPGRVTRRFVLGALALAVLVVPAAAVTPFERPPLLVLVPQAALGLLALGWPARPSRRARVCVAALPAGVTAITVVAAAGEAPLYGYRGTGEDVLTAVAFGLLAAAIGAGFARTLKRDASGWWAVLLLLPPTVLLLVEQIVVVAGDATGLSNTRWSTFAVTAVLLPLLAAGPIPLATFLRNRWQTGGQAVR